MTSGPWTLQEQERLRRLHLDPLRTPRERLTSLVRHFMDGGGIWTVSEGATGSLRVSRGLARKVRDLVRERKLDWVLGREAPDAAPEARWLRETRRAHRAFFSGRHTLASALQVNVKKESRVDVRRAQAPGYVCTADLALTVANTGTRTAALRELRCTGKSGGRAWKLMRSQPQVSQERPFSLRPCDSVDIVCTFIGGVDEIANMDEGVPVRVEVEASGGATASSETHLRIESAPGR